MNAALLARLNALPATVTAFIAAAFLLEILFYLAAAAGPVRERLASHVSGVRLAALVTASALLPYLIYSIGTGHFHLSSFLLLATLAAALSGWYLLLPANPLADLAFVAAMVGIMLGKLLDLIYESPGIDVRPLGHLMLIRVGAMAFLLVRGVHETGFGLIPNRRDWRIGILHFLYFLPIGFPLAWRLGLIQFNAGNPTAWKIAGTFLGALWVIALSEEFIFRGLLQRWLGKWTGSRYAGLIAASVLFGLVHLPFRSFPNWKFAAVAALAGFFYGRAFDKAGSIRASMVTHALVVTTWRAVFS